ncbi:hypothetical protein [Ensifer adhaerens]|uniref:hypothetical protein n=1 Tax=Ensifer adhaerens TaxID=106592 RepID=UPI000DC3A06E|nr:hypothetical protein [Ensifer adhaerens]RAS08337.1 hypothetical protein DEU52_11869 [Ensifer adhaerens]
MDPIEKSSRESSNIIGVIDDIAFQTNLTGARAADQEDDGSKQSGELAWLLSAASWPSSAANTVIPFNSPAIVLRPEEPTVQRQWAAASVR